MNADALSRKPSALTNADIPLSGISVPITMQPRCSDVNQQVLQVAVSVFPIHDPDELIALQEVDPTISAFLTSWRPQRCPERAKRACLSPKVLELF